MHRRNFLKTFGAFTTLLTLTPRCINAETLSGTSITRLPVVINKPGTYTLHRNLTLREEGPAIEVAADNVTIDLNGYQMTAGDSLTIGVRILGRQNVTVKNGKLVQFSCGVYADSCDIPSSNLLIEDLRIESAALAGIFSRANASIIQNNFITEFGNSQFATGALGILASDHGSLIKNNQINIRCPKASDAPRLGIYLAGGAIMVRENIITNCHLGIGLDFNNWYAWNLQPIRDSNTVINAARAFVF